MMFARMFRTSRRHVHEQISQNEETTDENNMVNTSSNEIDGAGIVSASSERLAGAAAAPSSGNGIVVLGESQQNRSGASLSRENRATILSTAGGNNVENRSNSILLSGGDEQEVGNVVENDDQEGMRTEQRHSASTNPFRTSLDQTERDMRIRRQSTCSILIIFFLIRLWVETLLEKDVGLLFLSLISTVWTYRWFVNRREAEESDRQLMGGGTSALEGNNHSLLLREDGEDVEGRRRRRDHGVSSGADAAINFDPDLGLMSFQAQLALAILESQRQMFVNGGYNAGNNNAEGPGVTDEAKEKWQRYEWGEDSDHVADDETIKAIRCSNYGSVNSTSRVDLTQQDHKTQSLVGEGLRSTSCLKKLSPSKLLEGGSSGLLASFDGDKQECPSCSICLCEYECGEKLIRLPCDHLYHEQCLNSWTENHVRCPLCNYDLMDGFEQRVTAHQQARENEEQLREFRMLALSALGRRLRPRRTTAGSNRGGSSTGAVTAAELAEATDDSIV